MTHIQPVTSSDGLNPWVWSPKSAVVPRLLVQPRRGSNLRLSVPKIVIVALTLLAWSSDPAVAQTLLAGQGRLISVTGNLSVRRASMASRVIAVNETVGIGDELAT